MQPFLHPNDATHKIWIGQLASEIFKFESELKIKRVSQLQAAANPWHQEEERKDRH